MYLYQDKTYVATVLLSNSNIDEQLEDIKEKFSHTKPSLVVFDTETTGLSHIEDKPFLVGFGFDKYLYVYEPNEKITNFFYELSTNVNWLFAHNAKYDYHMMWNGGNRIPESIKIADSMTVARLTEFADIQDSISLETLGGKYVSENSKFAGKVIKDKLKKIKASRSRELKRIFKNYFLEKNPKSRIVSSQCPYSNLIHCRFDTGFSKFFPKMKFEELFANIDVQEIGNLGQMYYQEPTYEDVYKENPELMISYLFDDLVILLEYLKVAMPVLEKTDPEFKILSQEGELIPVVAEMERVGLKADWQYLLDSRQRVYKYQSLLYRHLRRLTGKKFSSGQHQVIKDTFLQLFGIYLEKTDIKQLKNVIKSQAPRRAKMIAETILELRTLDKWLSTYIEGMLERMIDGRIYTSINNSGTVTGRVSSDLQQQPKDPLLTRRGKELFHPRKVFINDPDTLTYYFDFNAMELRLQAHYTMIVGKGDGDYNLCTAFIPFKHYNVFTGEMFEYPKDNWQDDVWVNDNGDLWTPTDPHNETALKAFPHITKDHPDWKHYRSLGKRANFLKNYGGGYKAIMEQMDLDEDVAYKLDKAYYLAFPKILDYQNDIVKQLRVKGYIENLFGRRYYFSDSNNFYKGFNYMIQGGCADLMKRKEIQLSKFIKANNLKSKLAMVVHDEVQIIIPKDELWVVDEIRKIMDDNPEVTTIPMTAGVEVSYTNWAEKEELE